MLEYTELEVKYKELEVKYKELEDKCRKLEALNLRYKHLLEAHHIKYDMPVLVYEVSGKDGKEDGRGI